MGQFFYVFAHEMGHAMFDILRVPIFGNAEDAADQFATYIMLQFGKDQARRLITGAALSYKQVRDGTASDSASCCIFRRPFCAGTAFLICFASPTAPIKSFSPTL